MLSSIAVLRELPDNISKADIGRASRVAVEGRPPETPNFSAYAVIIAIFDD